MNSRVFAAFFQLFERKLSKNEIICDLKMDSCGKLGGID